MSRKVLEGFFNITGQSGEKSCSYCSQDVFFHKNYLATRTVSYTNVRGFGGDSDGDGDDDDDDDNDGLLLLLYDRLD